LIEQNWLFVDDEINAILKALYERTGIDARPLFYGATPEQKAEALKQGLAMANRRREKNMAAWKCHLLQSSPRYENWRKILESDEAPIISPTPIKTLLGAEMADVFRLNVAKLTADQRERLIDFIVEKFGVARATAQSEIETSGFPIRAADVVVAFDHRFFT
jgi:hypothetical protein